MSNLFASAAAWPLQWYVDYKLNSKVYKCSKTIKFVNVTYAFKCCVVKSFSFAGLFTLFKTLFLRNSLAV